MSRINVGEPTTIEATFRVDGVLTTPSNTTITALRPSGDVVSVTSNVVSVGVIRGTYTPSESGIHYVRFEGTGDAAGIHEYPIYVHPRLVPAP